MASNRIPNESPLAYLKRNGYMRRHGPVIRMDPSTDRMSKLTSLPKYRTFKFQDGYFIELKLDANKCWYRNFGRKGVYVPRKGDVEFS